MSALRGSCEFMGLFLTTVSLFQCANGNTEVQFEFAGLLRLPTTYTLRRHRS
jgi:hypothetical protein